MTNHNNPECANAKCSVLIMAVGTHWRCIYSYTSPTARPLLCCPVCAHAVRFPTPPLALNLLSLVMLGCQILMLLLALACCLLYEVPAHMLASVWHNCYRTHDICARPLVAPYFTNFSSSLLFALIGGPCCSSGLLPPRSASQEPRKVVPSVAIASCYHIN